MTSRRKIPGTALTGATRWALKWIPTPSCNKKDNTRYVYHWYITTNMFLAKFAPYLCKKKKTFVKKKKKKVKNIQIWKMPNKSVNLDFKICCWSQHRRATGYSLNSPGMRSKGKSYNCFCFAFEDALDLVQLPVFWRNPLQRVKKPQAVCREPAPSVGDHVEKKNI